MQIAPRSGGPVPDVASLLARLAADGGRPRLTWYGDDGERVELSGAVLANWASKTVNLLVEEFDAAPGTTVVVDLPVHWRAAVWTLAAWRTGATVALPDAAVGGP
ncbi:TIGR03089 family protein, partial [Promicromonospora kroppenstedtii]